MFCVHADTLWAARVKLGADFAVVSRQTLFSFGPSSGELYRGSDGVLPGDDGYIALENRARPVGNRRFVCVKDWRSLLVAAEARR